MNSITVSAPGKLMLFGEHSVVYNRPCIVTAVGQRMFVTVEKTQNELLLLDAPDVNVKNYKRSLKAPSKDSAFKKPLEGINEGDIPKGAKFVEIAVKNFKEKYPFKGGLSIKTKSEFSSQFGFGSSSASTVCTIKALSELFNKKLTNKLIFDLSYKTVLDIQGKGSGFDVAAAIYGGTIYFWTGGKVIKPLHLADLPLVVGYSGVKADTVTLINQVKERANKFPKIVEGIYDQITQLVEEAHKILKQVQSDKNRWEKLGELMNINHGYLSSLGVSIRKLEEMIYSAREAGAYCAKLSGAGGGDCMIALAPSNRKSAVMKAINKVGKAINVKANVEGVRVESNG